MAVNSLVCVSFSVNCNQARCFWDYCLLSVFETELAWGQISNMLFLKDLFSRIIHGNLFCGSLPPMRPLHLYPTWWEFSNSSNCITVPYWALATVPVTQAVSLISPGHGRLFQCVLTLPGVRHPSPGLVQISRHGRGRSARYFGT